NELGYLDAMFEFVEEHGIFSEGHGDGLTVENGYMMGTATSFKTELGRIAKAQGERFNLSPENVGKWLGGPVANSSVFSAEQVSTGRGTAKRYVWKVGRKTVAEVA